MEVTGPTNRRALRRDAAENLERLLAAAVRAGLARGRHVPMAEIAADAGVGVGTLYRRFTDRDSLIEALKQRAYRLLIDVADQADGSTTAGRDAVEQFLTGSFTIRKDLVLPLHGAPARQSAETTQLAHELHRRIARMVARGHHDGTIRIEVSAWTIISFGALLAQQLDDSPRWRKTAKDQRSIFLRGISPTPPAE